MRGMYVSITCHHYHDDYSFMDPLAEAVWHYFAAFALHLDAFSDHLYLQLYETGYCIVHSGHRSHSSCHFCMMPLIHRALS